MAQKNYAYIPISFKFLGIVLIGISICAFFIGYFEYSVTKNKLAAELGETLEHIAVTGTLLLDAEVHREISSKDDPSYTDIQAALKKIKDLNRLKSPVYTLAKKFKRFEYVVSTEQGTLLGGEYRARKELEDVFARGIAAYTPIYTDKNGTWISAYAPIKDKSGAVLAALEIDKHAGDIMLELKRRLLVIIMSCAAGFLFSVIFTLPILRPMTSSIHKIGRAAEELEKGNYDYEAGVKSSDEIGFLAEAFNKMRVSMKQYIKELKDAQGKVVRGEKLAAIGKLASTVGHELRNPLGVMRNSVYFVKMHLADRIKDDEKAKRHLDILDEEIANSDRIIANLLEFAKTKEPIFNKTNINNTVAEAVSKIKLDKKIKLAYNLDNGLPQIDADEFQIKQVITNMALNAISAMPEAGRLTIGTKAEGENIKITIEDTGAGIPEENLDRLFEPLFSTRPKGTGLGLSLCNTIVENHKGHIEVKSRVGEGTVFTITLPQKQVVG